MGQLGLQLRSVEFQAQSLLLALQIFVVIVQAVLSAQQQKIRRDSLMKTNGEQENECAQKSGHEAGKHVEVIENDAFHEQLSEGNCYADRQMKGDRATPSSYVLCETDDQAKRQKALGPPKDKLLPSTKVSNLARESALAKETSELWPG